MYQQHVRGTCKAYRSDRKYSGHQLDHPVNLQASAPNLSAESNTSAISKSELFLSRGHTFRHVDSMTEEHELIDDMVPARMPVRLHVELVSWYSCLWEYCICKPIILPRDPCFANELHVFEKSGFFP